MAVWRQAIILCCYAGLAAAVAVLLPERVPAVERELAIAAGIIVFLGGALAHEIGARIGRDKAVSEQMLALGEAHALLHEDLCWTRAEAKNLAGAVETVAHYARQGQRSRVIQELNAEIKVLKSLVARLSSGRNSSLAGVDHPLELAEAASQALSGPICRPLIAPPRAENLDEVAVLDIVREALREDRVDVVLQPIVSLPQRKTRFYECFTRVRTEEGAVIVPEQYIPIAEREGLITAIDNMLLFRCMQLVRKIQRKSRDLGFFCNISAHTLADEDFFGDFVDFLDNNEELAPNLVFEFAERDVTRHGAVEAGFLSRLRRLGCRLSLDQVKSLDIQASSLTAHPFRFVKVDAGLIFDSLANGRGRTLNTLKRRLDGKAIDLIAEKIEDERSLLALLDYGLDFGQGYLFGEPRLARLDD